MTRIKKHRSGNCYSLTGQGVWVRDFNLPTAPLDISGLSSREDYPKFLENEVLNDRGDVPPFEPGSQKYESAVIVSDGYGFKEKQKILTDIPKNVAVIAANRSVVKWEVNKKIDYFVVNNPYPECMSLLPEHRYYPKCLVSTRTYPSFVQTYRSRGGTILSYSPSPEATYSSPSRSLCYLDEYRNPIAACVSLAKKLGVRKLLLLCCDDSFSHERPSAVALDNGLWMYPQHLISHGILDGMFGWYKKSKNIKIADHSSGPVYEHASYITHEEIVKFFTED